VFLKAPAEELIKSKDFHKVPILVGTTNHEFGWVLAQVSVIIFLYGIVQWNKWSTTLYDYYEIGNPQTIHGAEQDVLIYI